jgi:hypothetical protein
LVSSELFTVALAYNLRSPVCVVQCFCTGYSWLFGDTSGNRLKTYRVVFNV